VPLKNTPKDHESYAQTKTVATSLDDISSFLNDCMTRDLKMKKILDIQKRQAPPLSFYLSIFLSFFFFLT